MRTVSHYELLEKLGEGGMGVVWKARDARLGRFAAIKFLSFDKTRDAERRGRFTQEARAASALNHPGIVTIYEIGRDGESDFIAMEFVPGKTLDQVIPSKGMKVSAALPYAIQIADALAAAHAAGIVHRDIKPANVMVTENGHVKLLDFGLARVKEGGPPAENDYTRTISDRPRTQEGTIVGTVSYMSPEQAEGKKVDARSDIFSFGALLYEMLTGQRAFRGDSRMSTLAAVLTGEPQPLEKLAEKTPPDLSRLVRRCLRKDPDNRAQSMADVRVALKEIREESESGARAASRPAPRRKAFRGWIAAASLLFAAAAAAAYAWLATRTARGIPLQASLLTSYPGSEASPTFSPDGSQVAFAWSGGEGADRAANGGIYVKLLGAEKPLRLTTGPDDEAPAWSPDGEVHRVPSGKLDPARFAAWGRRARSRAPARPHRRRGASVGGPAEGACLVARRPPAAGQRANRG